MKFSQFLKILTEVYPILVRDGVIDANGDFHDPTTAQWEQLTPEVEAVLKANGVVVPDIVDKVIKIVPLLLAIAAVK